MALIAILALTCDRVEETARTWAHNFWGHAVPVFWWDNSTAIENQNLLDEIADNYNIRHRWRRNENFGIAYPINAMALAAFAAGHDIVVTMADDILEPEGWVFKMQEGLEKIPRAGIVASPPRVAQYETLRYEKQEIDGVFFEEGDVIGNWAFSQETYRAAGPLPEYYGIYGPIDLDYCARVRKAGFRTCYLSDLPGEHIGHSSPIDEEKKRSLEAAWRIFAKKMNEING